MKSLWLPIVLLFVALVIWGCIHSSHTPAVPATPAAVMPSPACGALLNGQLAHVYHPDRLHVMEKCKVVTGVVDLVGSERDGDIHIRLRLDPGQGQLTNARNDERQGGDLVVEPICKHNVTQRMQLTHAMDSQAVCRGRGRECMYA